MSSGRFKISPQVLSQLRRNVGLTIIRLLIFFSLGLVIGCGILYGASYVKYRDEYIASAKAVTKSFLAGEGINTSLGMNAYIMNDNNRVLLKRESGDSELHMEYKDLTSSYKLSGSENEYSFWLTLHNGKFYIISGVRKSVLNSPKNVLDIYYLWNIPNISIAFNAFLIAYLCVFLLCCLLVFLYYLKIAEMETMRRDYVSNVSHELKTPIASIKAITEALSDGMVKDQGTQSRYLGIILNESNRLEQAVINLLELNRLQAASKMPECSFYPIASIMDPICDRFFYRCEDLGIKFTHDPFTPDMPQLYTNKHRITELLEILLDNAVKFTDQENGEIHLGIKYSPRSATIVVRDNGIGIKSKDIPHIFERFYKANENNRGSGLGLAIASEITRQLGQKIWVKSRDGEGAAFYFTVSLCP